MSNGKEITLYDHIDNPIQFIEQMGKWFLNSGLFGIKTPEQGCILALSCVAEKKDPLEQNRKYHFIEGRLSMKADYMLAEFLNREGLVQWAESTEEVCRAVFIHPRYAPNGVTVTITLKELKDSGIAVRNDGKGLKDNYRKFPRQMLRARAITEGVKMVMPQINAGIYTPEEISDFDDEAYTLPASSAPARAFIPAEASPVPKPEPAPRKPAERARAAIEKFAALGVLQKELEAYLGASSEDWTNDNIEKLLSIYTDLNATPVDQRRSRVQEVFSLEPGAMG